MATSSVQAQTFSDRFVEMLNHASVMLMISLGHRTELFDAMAELDGGGTSLDIAQRASLSERYVREWLGAMLTGGVVTFDPATRRYTLPAEHAAWLTRKAAPQNLAVTAQWVAVLGAVENEVADAFRHGEGLGYESYKDFHRVMAEESGQTTVAALDDLILPLLPGFLDKLAGGIDVLDIGCGAGRALCHLAQRFPRSRFRGYDLSEEAVGAASEEARRRGLSNLRFEVRDAAALDERQSYDLVTAFDAIHDQRFPDKVLAAIRRSLKPDGVFLMQDISASSEPHRNVGATPLAPFIYTISCMHCMSVALQDGGMGLGAAWGREQALRMLASAGFASVDVSQLPHDILNCYYVARPG